MDKVVIPADDPYDFVVRSRSSPRGMDEPPSPADVVEEAYGRARMFLDLSHPFSSSGWAPTTVLDQIPRWVMERALSKLVKEGVLRGPETAPRKKEGKPAIYNVRNLERWDLVVWAEGAWRSLPSQWHTDFRRLAKAKDNRTRRCRGYRRGVMLPKPVLPGRSKTLMVKDYVRALPAVDWDGMAYFPVEGRAMDELLEWRERQRKTPREAGPSTECERCGLLIPGERQNMRVLHPRSQCNLLIITRVMGS
jgi:hypothetical protein